MMYLHPEVLQLTNKLQNFAIPRLINLVLFQTSKIQRFPYFLKLTSDKTSRNQTKLALYKLLVIVTGEKKKLKRKISKQFNRRKQTKRIQTLPYKKLQIAKFSVATKRKLRYLEI